jgi:hypothetical protein
MRQRETISQYCRQALSRLGMSRKDVKSLLTKTDVERSRELISLFNNHQDDCERLDIMFVLARIGDTEIAGNFYVDVLSTANPWLKHAVAKHGRMLHKFKGHKQLHDAIDDYLHGLSLQDALTRDLRDAFPNGLFCPFK